MENETSKSDNLNIFKINSKAQKMFYMEDGRLKHNIIFFLKYFN